MQTRVNSTRPSGKEAMSRINEVKPTFFGPPVFTQMPAPEDHLQRLKSNAPIFMIRVPGGLIANETK